MGKYNIFICYRGNSIGALFGDSLYKSIYISNLTENYGDLSCFFAPICIEKMGNFKEAEYEVIEEAKVFIMLLTPGFFEKCKRPDDQVYFEIKTVLSRPEIQIIPVQFPDFSYDDTLLKELFTEEEIGRFKHINPLFYRNIYDVNNFYNNQFLPILLDAIGISNFVRTIDPEMQKKYLCSELQKVFPARHLFQNVYDMEAIVENASVIECMGISNNELTLNLGVAKLQKAINRGCNITMAFLDPDSRFNNIREEEEKQPEGNISSNTRVSINQAVRACGRSHHDNVRLLKYDTVPRLNLTFINRNELYMQYYAPSVEGYNNPVFVIRRNENNKENSIFEFYYKCFEKICSEAVEISQEG